jgi:hypothetical protein
VQQTVDPKVEPRLTGVCRAWKKSIPIQIAIGTTGKKKAKNWIYRLKKNKLHL